MASFAETTPCQDVLILFGMEKRLCCFVSVLVLRKLLTNEWVSSTAVHGADVFFISLQRPWSSEETMSMSLSDHAIPADKIVGAVEVGHVAELSR